VIRELSLKDHTEEILLLATPGSAEDWGDFEVFRGTSWEGGVCVVSGASYSHALHGHLIPLLRELGRDPRASGRRVSEEEGLCGVRSTCMSWNPKLCRPGGQHKGSPGPPTCYDAPLESPDPEVAHLFRRVALAWSEGRHTVVVEGPGFNYR